MYYQLEMDSEYQDLAHLYWAKDDYLILNSNWGKFNYNYDISYEKKPQDILFALLGIYAANYYIAAVAGSV
jgi:hypothetical protein